MYREHAVTPPPNTRAVVPASARAGENGSSNALSLVESYRRLADVFHDVLSEQSLDSLLERIADTVNDLIPHDDLAFYEADEATRELTGVFARGEYADEVVADEPFAFGEGITGWAVENRQPVLANRADLDPRVRFVEGTPPDPESLIARGGIKGALTSIGSDCGSSPRTSSSSPCDSAMRLPSLSTTPRCGPVSSSRRKRIR